MLVFAVMDLINTHLTLLLTRQTKSFETAFNQMALPYSFYVVPTCSILTLLSAIACIVSKSTSSHSYYAARHSGKAEASIILETEIPKEKIALAPYPYYLGLSASTVVLAASSIALVISVGFTALSAFVMFKRYPIKVSLYVVS
jgi:hypothetical protein